ncbi:PPOX class F420-dependent oxidoreductase [Mycolicibacterium sarraceniae]|uniref:PPOX class F420-dependent oxidoreductase n=1 Tax=Mycolicibacterium sarraceniae TaxID=1534348 RepID=A0A7I7SVL7_9MYCO|nr:PPOX class F420-dependent oxidoreductase [Mycolicibacterium sarraceniae]BBY61064.1 PPOX class F420-dependent oxidoreductase [Mycolicibacterium sarraceniae]
MALTFADVVAAKYISLVTFTKDGRPKPTAVWVVPDGNTALVISEKDAWKVKRIRNTPRVTVAVCDMRGNVKGEAVEAVARVLDESQTERVYQAIGKRYGIIGHVFNFFSKLRGGTKRTIGIELRAA